MTSRTPSSAAQWVAAPARRDTSSPARKVLARSFVGAGWVIRDLTAWESNDYVKTIHAAIPSAQIVFDAGGASRVSTPVFGCPLVMVGTQQQKGKRAW